MNSSYSKFAKFLETTPKLRKCFYRVSRGFSDFNVQVKYRHKIIKSNQKFIRNIYIKVVQFNKRSCFDLCTQIRTYSVTEKHVYHKEIINAMNEQISTEFNAMFAYLSMACYFGRNDVALPGCYGLFMSMHDEEHDHALKFINYQHLRGAEIELRTVEINGCKEWNIFSAFAFALQLEIQVTEKLMALNKLAEKYKDPGLVDLISSHHIPQQEESICQMSRLLTRLTSMGKDGTAIFLFDKEIHNAFVKKAHKKYALQIVGGHENGKNKYI